MDGPIHTAGVRALRNDLATLLRRVADGERIVITSHGRPIAQLGPVDGTGEATIEELVARGSITAPHRAGRALEPEPEDLAVDVRLDDVLATMRGDG